MDNNPQRKPKPVSKNSKPPSNNQSSDDYYKPKGNMQKNQQYGYNEDNREVVYANQNNMQQPMQSHPMNDDYGNMNNQNPNQRNDFHNKPNHQKGSPFKGNRNPNQSNLN